MPFLTFRIARVWDNDQLAYELIGHSYPVLGAVGLPSGQVVTGILRLFSG